MTYHFEKYLNDIQKTNGLGHCDSIKMNFKNIQGQINITDVAVFFNSNIALSALFKRPPICLYKGEMCYFLYLFPERKSYQFGTTSGGVNYDRRIFFSLFNSSCVCVCMLVFTPAAWVEGPGNFWNVETHQVITQLSCYLECCTSTLCCCMQPDFPRT